MSFHLIQGPQDITFNILSGLEFFSMMRWTTFRHRTSPTSLEFPPALTTSSGLSWTFCPSLDPASSSDNLVSHQAWKATSVFNVSFPPYWRDHQSGVLHPAFSDLYFHNLTQFSYSFIVNPLPNFECINIRCVLRLVRQEVQRSQQQWLKQSSGTSGLGRTSNLP